MFRLWPYLVMLELVSHTSVRKHLLFDVLENLD